ncbi:hypothetical protein MBCUT_12490 [Methanobrevibacter cuticularis]|uniref:Uncharacterized protein n=1 Tax=Methanobrevibacter cuticularis TaxID=47311 RepID=A0A166DPR6_9EURY|nr:hypothetical protein [Methanobrevibacter cuticularis]KZX15829.1 hypothetical protein MBCUT_12490 [Methanobrevibacter cuticularis]
MPQNMITNGLKILRTNIIVMVSSSLKEKYQMLLDVLFLNILFDIREAVVCDYH